MTGSYRFSNSITQLPVLMCFDGPNGYIKAHEILKGENLDLGPSNHMSFLGPSNHMRW